MKTSKRNWFDTLNEALASENLLAAWDCLNAPIGYDETRSFTWEDGTARGHFISIYRDERGRYERPVHYQR